MHTPINRKRPFIIYGTVLAMAALLAVLLAATMTAGLTQAQDFVTPTEPRTGENSEEYDAPLPCSEKAEPDDQTAKVINGGHYAVFDAFWDYEVGHLSNNFCPPSVMHRAKAGRNPAVDVRTDAHTHISETVFSVPDRYKVTVVDSGVTNGNPSNVTGPKIDLANYPFLRDAVSAVKPGPDSTAENPTTVFADNSVWWVKAENVPANTDANTPLILGFSTDLMEKADWYRPDGPDEGTEPEPPVQFQFVAVHVLKDGSPQEAHVVGAHFFAFDPGTSQREAKWSTVDAATSSGIQMFTDQYRHMQYVFTKPGQYRVQAEVKGHVRGLPDRLAGAPADWSPIHPGASVSSPAEWYTFHVGPEDDLSVTITAADETPDDAATTITDSNVSFTVTATNTGPEDAKNAVVQVQLPEGLLYHDGSARVGSATTGPSSSVFNYEAGVIAWDLGRFGNYGTLKEGETRNASPATLTFTADVATGAGKRLTATAESRNTDRQTLDSNPGNDTSSVTVVRSSGTVRPPILGSMTCSIPEHAVAGTHCGDPVEVYNPDGRQLSFSLSGHAAGWFVVHPHGQIALAAGKSLDYEEQWAFPLNLNVSDGVNSTGGADTSIDDSMTLLVKVVDTEVGSVHPRVNFITDPVSPVAGDQVRVWARVAGLTFEEGSFYYCLWTDESGNRISESFSSDCHVDLLLETAGTQQVKVHVKWDTGGMTADTSVTWAASE